MTARKAGESRPGNNLPLNQAENRHEQLLPSADFNLSNAKYNAQALDKLNLQIEEKQYNEQIRANRGNDLQSKAKLETVNQQIAADEALLNIIQSELKIPLDAPDFYNSILNEQKILMSNQNKLEKDTLFLNKQTIDKKYLSNPEYYTSTELQQQYQSELEDEDAKYIAAVKNNSQRYQNAMKVMRLLSGAGAIKKTQNPSPAFINEFYGNQRENVRAENKSYTDYREKVENSAEGLKAQLQNNETRNETQLKLQAQIDSLYASFSDTRQQNYQNLLTDNLRMIGNYFPIAEKPPQTLGEWKTNVETDPDIVEGELKAKLNEQLEELRLQELIDEHIKLESEPPIRIDLVSAVEHATSVESTRCEYLEKTRLATEKVKLEARQLLINQNPPLSSEKRQLMIASYNRIILALDDRMNEFSNQINEFFDEKNNYIINHTNDQNDQLRHYMEDIRDEYTQLTSKTTNSYNALQNATENSYQTYLKNGGTSYEGYQNQYYIAYLTHHNNYMGYFKNYQTKIYRLKQQYQNNEMHIQDISTNNAAKLNQTKVFLAGKHQGLTNIVTKLPIPTTIPVPVHDNQTKILPLAA